MIIAHTSIIDILPDGISRFDVLGFFASMSLSIRLFSAIAALRAPRKASPTQSRIGWLERRRLQEKLPGRQKDSKKRML